MSKILSKSSKDPIVPSFGIYSSYSSLQMVTFYVKLKYKSLIIQTHININSSDSTQLSLYEVLPYYSGGISLSTVNGSGVVNLLNRCFYSSRTIGWHLITLISSFLISREAAKYKCIHRITPNPINLKACRLLIRKKLPNLSRMRLKNLKHKVNFSNAQNLTSFPVSLKKFSKTPNSSSTPHTSS